MSIRIDFLSNTRSVTRDAATLADTFDKVVDSLDDVASAAHKSGSKISSEYDDASKDGQRSAERLERAFKEASDQTAASSKQGAEHMAKNTKEGVRESSEGLSTLKEEAKQNASETFSSFDGSASSFADGIQGTLGGIVSDLGPLGAAAGAAGALGIGLITAAMTNGQEQSEAFKQDVADLGQDLVTTGSRGSASLGKVVSALQDLATGQDSAGNTLGKLQDLAHDTGISYKDLAIAYAGNGKGLSTLLDLQKDHLAALRRTQQAQQQGNAGYQSAKSAIDNQVDSQEKLISTLENTSKKQKAAAKEQKAYIDSGAEALDRQAQAAGSYSEAVQSAYADAGSDVKDYVEKGVFNLDRYQKATEANAQAIVDYTANMATAQATLAKGGHDRAIGYLEALGPDAAPLIAAFIKAPAAQQKSLEATWDTLGGAASTSFGTSLQSKLNAQVPTQTVKIVPDLTAVVNQLDYMRKHPSSIPVPLIPVAGAGSGVKRNP